MNENQLKIKNYVLIVKTIDGNLDDNNITVRIKGSLGKTERLLLGKSQSYPKAFEDNQTDLFLLRSNADVGRIYQIELDANRNAMFQQWKYHQIFIIDGTRVYHDNNLEYSLLSSMNTPTVINITDSSFESQEHIYYAFIKTGSYSCTVDGHPKLSLFGSNQQHIEFDFQTHGSSTTANNKVVFQKNQFDIFQWSDINIDKIERMYLQLYSENLQSNCQWSIEWFFVIHNGYSFTGRIQLNRMMKIDRYIDINLEAEVLPITREYGDSFGIETKYDMNMFNKQMNANTEIDGRYYVMIRNLEGTKGKVYIEFHGDQLPSSNEQYLSKCENYPDHQFNTKHTDLFHIKALEVGHVQSVSLRLDQTDREHSLTLDSMYLIHNAIVYEFNLKYIILNKEQSKKEFQPKSHSKLATGKTCYYIATHTSDKKLAEINAHFQVILTGTKGKIGPFNLKESLTNGNNPFEKECIDLFHIEDNDIGDPISITITLVPKNSSSHSSSTVKCDRIMLVKNGEYNSLWQIVGDLKLKEPVIISPHAPQRPTPKQPAKALVPPPVAPIEDPSVETKNEITPIEQLLVENKKEIIPIVPSPDPSPLPKLLSKERIEIQPVVNNLPNYMSDDHYQHGDEPLMAAIDDLQKRYTYASTLREATENYRELKRLLNKKLRQNPNRLS